jgi:hypothetical protein
MRNYAAVRPGDAVPYIHRDPAYVTPADRARFAARDARLRELQRRAAQEVRAERDVLEGNRFAAFCVLRGEGRGVREAGRLVGVTDYAGTRYEKQRLAVQDERASHPASNVQPLHNVP